MNTISPYALIEKDGTVTRYEGTLHELQTLDDLGALRQRAAGPIVFLNPYRTIRERGFEAHGNEPILALEVTSVVKDTRENIMNVLSQKPITLERPVESEMTPEAYAAQVQKIQQEEIAGGNICQMILSQKYRGKIKDFDVETLKSTYGNLLKQRGQYMTMLFSNGKDKHFVSTTPEQHLGMKNGEVQMNPIAGTIPIVEKGKPFDAPRFKERLIAFLRNPKEIRELFHVLDEELKMMEDICAKGGRIEGPFLRQNGAVVHTEYRLFGKDGVEPIKSLRATLHAPTLVGGPEESAARLIKKYEKDSRRYYGGEIGILETDGSLDSAIMIRAAEIQGDGEFFIQAGAGIVEDSIPLEEAQETQKKSAGTLAGITGNMSEIHDVSTILEDPEVLEVLKERNRFLSPFHFEDQSDLPPVEELKGKKIVILNNEDNFAKTMCRMISRMGAEVRVVDTMEFDEHQTDADLVVVGPGPGDINDMSAPRMRRLMYAVDNLRQKGVSLFGVCLGHQALARSLGIPVEKQDRPTQGEQREIRIKGQLQKLGFYNSFSPKLNQPLKGLKSEQDEEGRLMTMEGSGFIGVQFHPESVMSQNGYALLRDYLIELTKPKK